MKSIILIAPPVAGKGTVAELLKTEYNIPHISTGDIFREIASHNDEMGSYIRETLASGHLVKDDIVIKLLEERLKKDDCQNGYILDGYPRTLIQATSYDKMIKHLNQELTYVFVFDIDKEILVKRITGRRICAECGAIYNINIASQQPKLDSICDKCHGRLYQRDDDNLEAFELRYQTYLKESGPLIKFYEDKGLVYHVDSGKSKEDTLASIKTIISEKEMR